MDALKFVLINTLFCIFVKTKYMWDLYCYCRRANIVHLITNFLIRCLKFNIHLDKGNICFTYRTSDQEWKWK